MANKDDMAVKKQDQASVAVPDERTYIPAVDILEDANSVQLLADMPGVSKDNLDIQIEKDTLQIHGKRPRAFDREGTYAEMPARDYYRAFTLGEDIDRENIAASISNGVLKIVLHKSERAKPRKIQIQYA
jgi:HSP20 family molecular chaperone IbpA